MVELVGVAQQIMQQFAEILPFVQETLQQAGVVHWHGHAMNNFKLYSTASMQVTGRTSQQCQDKSQVETL